MIVSCILFLLTAVIAGVIDKAEMPDWRRRTLSILCYAAMAVVLALVPIIFPANLAGPLQLLAKTPAGFAVTMVGLWYGGYYIGGAMLEAHRVSWPTHRVAAAIQHWL